MPTARSKRRLARMKTLACCARPDRVCFHLQLAKILTRGCVQNGTGTKINFDDANWSPRNCRQRAGRRRLRGFSCAAPPIREFEIHPPVSSRTITNGDILFDLGQNAAHIPKISVTGPAGSRVRIIPSELGDGLVKRRFDGREAQERHLVRLHQSDGRRGNAGRRNFSTSAVVIFEGGNLFDGQGRNQIGRREIHRRLRRPVFVRTCRRF